MKQDKEDKKRTTQKQIAVIYCYPKLHKCKNTPRSLKVTSIFKEQTGIEKQGL